MGTRETRPRSEPHPTSVVTTAARTGALALLGPATRHQSAVREAYDSPPQRIETAKQLYAIFVAGAKSLPSDSTMAENGFVRVCIKHDAPLTSDTVIAAAQRVAAKKARYA